ncbi:class-III pyridoxal-phosphate-dependent aminotransferase [Desulfoluna spongiiphila]|uniref:class-III pyridoxal-phosphate-dependent aminotransferase n=1 Tax=Desulfoluna spongiiphila TaxID=419481 RepID=UPI00125A1984|nr:aspartate aminotransferase family protein [Desulfoluna spongiiphila]VVS93757.1 pyridoxal phosphate-dependent transferase [Desulfoluna spongiiphila]
MDPVIWYPGHEKRIGPIVSAKNCTLYDEHGSRYTDLESGVWCTSVGHAHPRILKVMAGQAERLAHTGFSFSSQVVAEAALEILALHGFEGGACTFLCSGSEAVEYGVRVARQLSERPLFLTMSDSYFGAYGSASTRGKEAWLPFDWSGCEACPHQGPCSSACDLWKNIPFESVGGFLFEPGSSSGFVRFPPTKLIEGLARTIHQNGGLLIVNEVTTGIGRTGRWFGYQHYDVVPDIVAMGKGIGNGYPVSVAACSKRVMERLGTPIPYSQSHQNDPLGAAIAREVIRIIREDDLIRRSNELSALLTQGLHTAMNKYDHLKAVRARGLMVAVDFKDTAGTPFTTKVHQHLLDHGYVVGRRPEASTLRLDPSLTIGESDLHGFLTTLDTLLAAEETDHA